MSYFDLSIPVDTADILRGDELARVRELITAAFRLGYNCVALDYRARLPLRPSDTCRLQCAALSMGAIIPSIVSDAAISVAAAAPRVLMSKRDATRLSRKRQRDDGDVDVVDVAAAAAVTNTPRVLSRITIALESALDGGRFAVARSSAALSQPLSPILSSWDIIAVEAADVASLEAAAGLVDIVSIDMSAAKLPFPVSVSLAATVLEKGTLFELRYAPAIRDIGARRFLIAGARALLMATRGRGVILASGGKNALEIRRPRDASAIASLFGLSLEAALIALSVTSAGVIAHAKIRKNGGVEVIV
jgi:RNase P/RNase MRP subunit p30